MQERRAALRQLALLLAIALPLSVAGVLWAGDFFSAYEGVAVAHRPLPQSDGSSDKLRRFVLVDSQGHDQEVILPTAAFKKWSLPLSNTGTPPITRPDNPPTVRKSRFTLSVVVGTRSWNTLSPAHLIPAFLFVAGVVIARNVIMTGGAFTLVATGKNALPGVAQSAPNVPARPPSRARPQKGPPPPRGSRKGKGRGKRPR